MQLIPIFHFINPINNGSRSLFSTKSVREAGYSQKGCSKEQIPFTARRKNGLGKLTTLEDLESRIDSLQKSNAMILEAQSEIKELLKERNHFLVEQDAIKRNTGWNS